MAQSLCLSHSHLLSRVSEELVHLLLEKVSGDVDAETFTEAQS